MTLVYCEWTNCKHNIRMPPHARVCKLPEIKISMVECKWGDITEFTCENIEVET